MTTAFAPTPITSPGPVPKHWTVCEFHQMGEYGLFEGKRAKLIDGQIIEEGPMNPPHATAITKTMYALMLACQNAAMHVRSQIPLVLNQDTDPMPDVYVVRGTPQDYANHPSTALLVIEVSDTSIRFDTTEKMSLYAAAGIADYWVVDINDRVLIVYRQPVAEASATYGHTYASVQRFHAGSTVQPLALPTASLAVNDLFP